MFSSVIVVSPVKRPGDKVQPGAHIVFSGLGIQIDVTWLILLLVIWPVVC